MRDRTSLTLTAVGLIAGWAAALGAEEPAGAGKKVSLVVVLSDPEYDPAKPSKAVLKCVVRNGTAEPAQVPVGYDGKQVQLVSGGLTLYRVFARRGEALPKKEGHVKTIQLGPGKEQVLFELTLDKILARDEEAREEWRWDWPRRPEPPRSPIHRWRKTGFHEQATFQAKVMIGGKAVRSETVVLKVKASDPAE